MQSPERHRMFADALRHTALILLAALAPLLEGAALSKSKKKERTIACRLNHQVLHKE